jgi:hypothetical protein
VVRGFTFQITRLPNYSITKFVFDSGSFALIRGLILSAPISVNLRQTFFGYLLIASCLY